jgi:hypothetical protein
MNLAQTKLALGLIEERYLFRNIDGEVTPVCDLSGKGLICSQRLSFGQ